MIYSNIVFYKKGTFYPLSFEEFLGALVTSAPPPPVPTPLPCHDDRYWSVVCVFCLHLGAESTVNFTGALQTEKVRSPPFKHLELHSPTRSVRLEAPKNIQVTTKAGDIFVESKFSASFTSDKVCRKSSGCWKLAVVLVLLENTIQDSDFYGVTIIIAVFSEKVLLMVCML